jgi:Glycosyltransferase
LVKIKSYNEGWLIGISNQLRKRDDIIFYYAFPQSSSTKVIKKSINGINFLGFYNNHKNAYKVEDENIKVLRSIINGVNPDLIHVFGTELPHELECIYSIPKKERNKVVVSVQGLTTEIAKVYTSGIPVKNRVFGKFNNNKYCCILSDNYEFYRRGMNEKKILQNVSNVIGRTEWDRKCVMSINQRCHYYHCNETLRDTFYEGSWNIENIQRYSIFVSQAYYPIKGLHILISALPYIKNRYSNVMVFVAGKKEFLSNAYGCYIKKMMKKMDLENDIKFVGYLSDEEMKRWLLKSHIMLMPSMIENSPNSIGEAMLLGTPVVASNVGGIPSILDNGTDGYLYSSMDKIDLAKKVCKIFASDRVALRISENGKKAARFLYNKENNIEQLIRIYKEITKNSKI